MRLKVGASIEGLHPQLAGALPALVDPVFRAYGADEAVVTSGTERTAPHVPRSLHWRGLAVDLRIRHIRPRSLWPEVAGRLEETLGSEFHVKLETSTGTAPHIHLSLPEPRREGTDV